MFHVTQNVTNETVASPGDLVLPLNTNIRKRSRYCMSAGYCDTLPPHSRTPRSGLGGCKKDFEYVCSAAPARYLHERETRTLPSEVFPVNGGGFNIW